MHYVYRSINKPLMVCGTERRLFFGAAVMGAATFNLFGSLLAGILMFLLLFAGARWATSNDPALLRILLNSSKWKSQYDPAKRGPHAS